jgi:imidazolonepropionase
MKGIKNLNQIITLAKASEKDGRNLLPEDLGILKNASIVYDDEQILWVGTEVPVDYKNITWADGTGSILLPELVDSHTHLIFAGDRSDEYAMRLNGDSYESIAKSGGGILATTTATNEINPNDLFNLCCERIEAINSYGIGTIEIKSGYGLNYEKEKELTLIIDKLKKKYFPKVQIFNTFLAAHAVPKDFKSSSEYIEKSVIPLLEELAPMDVIDAVDIFHEEGYFDTKDVALLFEEAKSLGLKVKSHADEFKDNKGAELACKYEALSCDHLLRTNDKGIKALVNSKTVACFLPGTAFFLGKEQVDARKFLDAGAKVAIASDYNPGSCHYDNLLQIALLAAPTYKMNIAQLWASITLNAAHSLGLYQQGCIKVGMKSRFSLFRVKSIEMLSYSRGKNFSFSLS